MGNTVIPVEIPVEWKYRWNGNTGGIEIPVEWKYRWNGNTGGTKIPLGIG
jgi:hypothetical protein